MNIDFTWSVEGDYGRNMCDSMTHTTDLKIWVDPEKSHGSTGRYASTTRRESSIFDDPTR
jgi:hypothetical protein